MTAKEPLGRRPGQIQSVDRAAQILKVLAAGRRLGVTEIAKRLDLPAPTVHGLLRTLHDHEFVSQDPAHQKYELGPGLLHLGSSYLDVNDLRTRATEPAARLAHQADAAVRVGVLLGPAALVIHHAFRPDRAMQVSEVGLKLPVHATALGKALLAFAGEQRVDDLLADPPPRLTQRTLGAPELRAQLAEIALTGVARERDEAVLGEAGVAAPIFDGTGALAGAIGVVGESGTLMPRGRARAATLTAVLGAARDVSRALGAQDLPARRRASGGA